MRAKALADLMEAIIGGFYVSGGVASGVWAVKALGAWPSLRSGSGRSQAPTSVVNAAASAVADGTRVSTVVAEKRVIGECTALLDFLIIEIKSSPTIFYFLADELLFNSNEIKFV